MLLGVELNRYNATYLYFVYREIDILSIIHLTHSLPRLPNTVYLQGVLTQNSTPLHSIQRIPILFTTLQIIPSLTDPKCRQTLSADFTSHDLSALFI